MLVFYNSIFHEPTINVPSNHISHNSFSFHSSTMFITINATSLEKENLQVVNIEAFVPPQAVLKYWLD